MSARRLAVAASLVAASLGAGCSRLVASHDDDGPWLIHETPHFTFHYRSGSLAEAALPRIAAETEAGRAEICARLAVAFDGVVIYYLYPLDEAADIGVVSGGFAYPDFLTIRQIYWGSSLGNHEQVHVIAGRVIGSDGSRLMGEGLATALSGGYGGRTLAQWRAQFFGANQVIGVDQLLWNGSDYGEAPFYPQSGSFVLYLLERFGPEGVKAVYTARPPAFRAAFAAAFGAELDTVFGEYQAARGAVP